MFEIHCSECRRSLPLIYGQAVTILCQGCGHQVFTFDRESCLICRNCSKNHIVKQEFHARCSCGSNIFIHAYEDDGEKLVLILRNRGLGDVLMTTIALREFRKRNPDARICYAVDSDVMPALFHNPNVDFLVTTKHGQTLSVFREKIDLLGKVEDYSEQKGINKGNRIERFMELLGVYNGRKGPLAPDYHVTRSERKYAERILCSNRKVVGLVLSSAATYRTWPEYKFRSLARRFSKDEVDVIVFDEKNASLNWAASGIVNVTGKTNVRQLGALISKCDLLISGDTGPYHLAAALNKPSIVFHGALPPNARGEGFYPKLYAMYEPSAAACIPCWDIQFRTDDAGRECFKKGPRCMKAITVKKVYEKAMEILHA